MVLTLTTEETRVLGCLMEKQLATPNVLPADPQRADRGLQPVLQPGPDHTTATPTWPRRSPGSARRAWRGSCFSSGQRAEKYRHVLDDLWGLDEQHRAVLAVMMLRGPQTVGELRTRTDRLARFDSPRRGRTGVAAAGQPRRTVRPTARARSPAEGGPLGRAVQRGGRRSRQCARRVRPRRRGLAAATDAVAGRQRWRRRGRSTASGPGRPAGRPEARAGRLELELA